MRCYLKQFIYTGIFDKIYQNENWDFTGRIMYQRDEDGDIVISFEITMSEYPEEPKWYSSYWFDFDDSTDAVIYDCNKNKPIG